MCTVTFLPQQSNGFILTSNRDEQSVRKKATPPRKYTLENQPVFFPKDLQAGGTWIATGINGYTLCLLNGGFEPHVRKEKYRMSRGLVLLDFFLYNDVHRYSREYSFNEIEPFTLLVVNASDKLALHELIWDGNEVTLNEIDPLHPKVWSSVTLYENKIIEERKRWFKQWLNKIPVPSHSAVMEFHQNGGNGDERNNLVMNRDNRLHTVSITSILKSQDGIYMKYHDLYDSKKYNIRII